MNPFDALRLPATAGLTDADVRAAWRDIATATHPDRDGGGDPPAYAAATAAYQQLRTPWGRTEALADLPDRALPRIPPEPAVRPRLPAAWRSAALLPARIRHGRPGRLPTRTIVATAAAVVAATVTAGTPSAPATVVGCLLWWAVTARGDLAPPPGR